MSLLPYVVTTLAGVLNAVHSGTNAQLNRSLERPFWAAMAVIVISGAVMLAITLCTRETMPEWDKVSATPWWAWFGTAIAAVPVITTVLFAGSLGAAAFNGIVVTATLVCSLALDHWGWIGFEQHRASPLRLLGGALMIGGVTLMACF